MQILVWLCRLQPNAKKRLCNLTTAREKSYKPSLVFRVPLQNSDKLPKKIRDKPQSCSSSVNQRYDIVFVVSGQEKKQYRQLADL